MEQFDEMLKAMAKQEQCAAPEGFDGRLQEVLDCLPPRAKKRRGLGAAKGALIAAACLALVGTAFAAVELAGVRVLDFFNNEPRVVNEGWEPEVYSGYIVGGDINYYPMDALSAEIRKISERSAKAVYKGFSSWEEMERFIGVNLMDNPVLAGSPSGIRHGTGGNDASAYAACINIRDGSVPRIWMYGSYLLYPGTGSYGADNSVSIQLEADLYTENATDPEYHTHRYYFSEGTSEGTTVSRKAYTSPGGLSAEIFRIDHPAHDEIQLTVDSDIPAEEAVIPASEAYTEYHAEFTLNGILFTVEAGECADDGLLWSVLLEVLDGFAV